MWRMGLASLLLHVFFLGIWGIRFSMPTHTQPTPLVVEFKNIQDVTRAPKIGKVIDENVIKDSTVAATAEPEAFSEIEHTEAKKEETPPEPVEETKPEPEAKPEPKQEKQEPEPKPEPKQEKPKPEVKEKDKKTPEKKQQPKPKEKPKDKEKPQKDKDKKKDPKTKEEKAIVQLKKGSKEGDKKVRNKPKNAKESKNALDQMLSDASDSGASEIGELSASHIDALRSRIKQCWAVPAGLLDARNIAVEIHIELNSDGTVLHANVIDQGRLASDPNFKIAADAAYRAVIDPACQPFPLPKDKYNVWKEIDITFDAHSMFG